MKIIKHNRVDWYIDNGAIIGIVSYISDTMPYAWACDENLKMLMILKYANLVDVGPLTNTVIHIYSHILDDYYRLNEGSRLVDFPAATGIEEI